MAPRGIRKFVHTLEQLTFCGLMRQARKKAGLTQQDLSKRLGKPQSFVAKYEGEERRLDVLEFITTARAIGAGPIRLLKALLDGLDSKPIRK